VREGEKGREHSGVEKTGGTTKRQAVLERRIHLNCGTRARKREKTDEQISLNAKTATQTKGGGLGVVPVV